jgi:hypothetical protein
MVVVFPAQFAPRRQNSSPSTARMFRWSRAGSPSSYRFVRSITSSIVTPVRVRSVSLRSGRARAVPPGDATTKPRLPKGLSSLWPPHESPRVGSQLPRGPPVRVAPHADRRSTTARRLQWEGQNGMGVRDRVVSVTGTWAAAGSPNPVFSNSCNRATNRPTGAPSVAAWSNTTLRARTSAGPLAVLRSAIPPIPMASGWMARGRPQASTPTPPSPWP